ncbi:hypothetical protein CGLO_06041 [Colletotrichum gloeosporioides Cg-14]|uniref:Uncharacterized protein n=1 Tax=Colletotrichum gloeosporioides (strain Cg-14) TaxID=1237896 RepID=T0KNP4_COLGC|nr:hypothetical protein CGLO_06041 [Colletotrichum gloeosporioides Cg-14]
MEEGLCIFRYIHDLQSAASTDLVRDPDHSLLQRAIRYCKIIASGKASEDFPLPMTIQKLMSLGSCANT